MTFQDYKQKLLKDPDFKKYYQKFDLFFEIEMKLEELKVIWKKWRGR